MAREFWSYILAGVEGIHGFLLAAPAIMGSAIIFWDVAARLGWI